MHFQKLARQWCSSLRAQGRAPKPWKTLHATIMKSFLASNAKNKVLVAWRSLKMMLQESVHKDIDKFWDLYLKACIFKRIHLAEQKQQFCAILQEEMSEYVSSKRPKSIIAVIHHTFVVSQIHFQEGKKPPQGKDAGEQKGKGAHVPYASKVPIAKKGKNQEKGYKGRSKLSLEKIEQYQKNNKCFK